MMLALVAVNQVWLVPVRPSSCLALRDVHHDVSTCGRQPSVVKCQLGPHLALPLEMSTMMLALVAVNQAWLSAS